MCSVSLSTCEKYVCMYLVVEYVSCTQQQRVCDDYAGIGC